MNSLKLKRHETFSIREGWLEKAINQIQEYDGCFTKTEGTTYLGIGSNMVKSLRYWLTACGIATFKSNGKAELTEFGLLLYEYDRFLDDDFSWWLIHENLVTNFKDCPVLNIFYNLDIDKFSKDFMKSRIQTWCYDHEYEYGVESSLDADVSIALKSYYSEDNSNPENNLNCPLGKLKLINKLDRNTYVKSTTHFDKLDYLVVYRLMIQVYEKELKSFVNGQETFTFNAEDMIDVTDSPLKVLGITKSSFFAYLEEMSKNGLIKFTKTAGLNTVSIMKMLNDIEIFEEYYKRG